jgi:hypothetical protein
MSRNYVPPPPWSEGQCGWNPCSPTVAAALPGHAGPPCSSALERAERAQRAERAHDTEWSRDPSSRIPWAELLKRTHDVDALACPCGGRLRFIAVITDREVARDLLESLGLPSTPPPLARARGPDFVDPIPDDG